MRANASAFRVMRRKLKDAETQRKRAFQSS
jgi:hypothetical protein